MTVPIRRRIAALIAHVVRHGGRVGNRAQFAGPISQADLLGDERIARVDVLSHRLALRLRDRLLDRDLRHAIGVLVLTQYSWLSALGMKPIRTPLSALGDS
jgi:hypothetical protein